MVRIAFKSFLLCLVIISCTDNSNEVSQDLLELGLSGKVKSVKEKSYSATEKFGEIVKIQEKRENPFDSDFFASYNESGKILEKEDYNLNGSLKWRHEYLYDEQGNRIASNVYDSNGKLSGKEIYEYDELQNLINKKYYNLDYLFNGVNERLTNNDNYIYNEKGLLIEETGGDVKFVNKYDNSDNLIDKDFFYNGRLNSKEVFEYNQKGQKISEKFYDSDGQLSSEKKFLYSNDEKLLEENTFHSGKKFTVKYDQNENILEEIEYKSDGTPIIKKSYKYIYDKNKNWTKKTVYKNLTPAFILEREINYYK